MLEHEHVARFPGARGRIPNFIGAEAAAKRLVTLPEWKAARVVKVNPDAPQLPIRAAALAQGKRLYMAVPRLRGGKPFILLDPARLKVSARQAASIKGASSAGTEVAISQMPHIDLVIAGTVAVNSQGVRIGKGGGFSDLEFALLAEAGLIDERTVLATTMHRLQLVDGQLPETEHDFRLDIIVTADDVIRTGGGHRPSGLIWADLDEDKIDEIPVLQRLAKSRR